jgi:Flp pilus assembly protein TadG
MKLRWWFRDRLGRRGVAAVEFAIVIPVLLVMFIGTIEILTLYRTEAKLNALASNVSQMVSIAQSVSTAAAPIASTSTASVTSLQDICQGAILGLQPFPPSGMTIAVASVTLETGPNGLPNTGAAYSKTPTFDVWESDSTVTGQTCYTGGGSQIGTATAEALATTPVSGGSTGNSGLLEVPCDSIIIVKASLKYAGITGLILGSRPTLTQTVFARWPYAQRTSELTCTGCTLASASQQICTTGNTATN